MEKDKDSGNNKNTKITRNVENSTNGYCTNENVKNGNTCMSSNWQVWNHC